MQNLPVVPTFWRREISRRLLLEGGIDKQADLANARSRDLSRLYNAGVELTQAEIKLVEKLRKASDPETVASTLGLANVDPNDATSWFSSLANNTLTKRNQSPFQQQLTLELIWIISPLSSTFSSKGWRSIERQSLAPTLGEVYYGRGLFSLAVKFLQISVGITEKDWSSKEIMKRCVDSYLQYTQYASSSYSTLYRLAYCIAFVPSMGHSCSRRLAEYLLNLEECDYTCRTSLNARITESLVSIKDDPDKLAEHANFIWQLSKSLVAQLDQQFGLKESRQLIEVWIGVDASDFQDTVRLRNVFTSGRLSKIPKLTQENLLCQLLMPRDGKVKANELLNVINAWIGSTIFDASVEGANDSKVASAFQKLQRYCSKPTVTKLVRAIGFAAGFDTDAPNGFGEFSIELLLKHLGIESSDLSCLDKLSTKLSRIDSGAYSMDLNMEVLALVEVLSHFKAGNVTVQLLIEAWLGVPIRDFLRSHRAKSMTPTALIQFPALWLDKARDDDSRIPAVCAAVVSYCRSLQEELGKAANLNKILLELLSDHGHQVVFAGLRHADWLMEQAKAEGLDLEIRVLEWAEVLQNQSLTASLPKVARKDRDFPTQVRFEDSNWPFLDSSRPEDMDFLEGYLPRLDRCWHRTQPLIALRQDPDNWSEPIVHNSAYFEEPAKSVRLRDADAGFPEGAVRIRTLFDMNGALRVWVMRKVAVKFDVVYRLKSEGQADTRIASALLRHDLAIEAIWIASKLRGAQVVISLEQLDVLKYLVELSSDEMFAENELSRQVDRHSLLMQLFAVFDQLKGAFPKLVAVAESFAFILLDNSVGQVVEFDRDKLASLLHAFDEHLHDVRNSRVCENHLDDLGDAERRQLLHLATTKLACSIQRDFDLETVWSSTKSYIDWRNTDVILSLQQRLWGIPVSILSFGGNLFYCQVASISCSIGVETIRSQASSNADSVLRRPRVVGAYWTDKPENGERVGRGFSLLHEATSRLTRDNGGSCFGLADCPAASVAELSSTINSLDESEWNMLIVGGHGCEESSGVALVDGYWYGQGADLRLVDIVIVASCTVGRINHDGFRSVAGLYVELLKKGCRSAVLAKWPIADTDTALYIAGFLGELMKARNDASVPFCFKKARALNRTRVRLVRERSILSEHVAAAFDLYGTP